MPLFRHINELPPIQLAIQIEVTTDANLREYLAEQTALFERMARAGVRCVSVIDSSVGSSINAVQRSMYADWINEHQRLLDQCLVGAAFVLPSMLLRGALTAIFWLARMSAPHTVHKELDGALAWAIEHARSSGLRLCPELERDGVAAFCRLRDAG